MSAFCSYEPESLHMVLTECNSLNHVYLIRNSTYGSLLRRSTIGLKYRFQLLRQKQPEYVDRDNNDLVQCKPIPTKGILHVDDSLGKYDLRKKYCDHQMIGCQRYAIKCKEPSYTNMLTPDNSSHHHNQPSNIQALGKGQFSSVFSGVDLYSQNRGSENGIINSRSRVHGDEGRWKHIRSGTNIDDMSDIAGSHNCDSYPNIAIKVVW